jgi:hypothetical protein
LYNGSGYTFFDPAGSIYTEALGVSGNNVVGRYSKDGESTMHGFLYNGSVCLALDVPGSTYTEARGVSGENIVGCYMIGYETHAFLYNGSGYATIDPPGSTSAEAYGVSGNNVVGIYWDVGGVEHGFLYAIPEPSTSILLAVGAFGLLAFACPLFKKRKTAK